MKGVRTGHLFGVPPIGHRRTRDVYLTEWTALVGRGDDSRDEVAMLRLADAVPGYPEGFGDLQSVRGTQ